MKPLIRAFAVCLSLCGSAEAQVDAPNAHLWASVMLKNGGQGSGTIVTPCLLYTSDAADEL